MADHHIGSRPTPPKNKLFINHVNHRNAHGF